MLRAGGRFTSTVLAKNTARILNQVGLFCTYAAVQILSYSLLTVNFRAIASGRLPLALLTDGINASLSFFIIRRIAKSEDSFIGWLGYLTGSLIGTTLGMWIDQT